VITFTDGDMFEIPADIRVNSVNCVGVMGAGVALVFKNKYPEMYEQYFKDCRAGKVRPGILNIWKNLSGEWIINFPTKDHWRKPSKYEYIESGLVALHDYLKDLGKIKVAIPALGSGHGGLDWNRVSEMIRSHLSDLESEIIVFNPSSTMAIEKRIRNGLDDKSLEQLKSRGIVIVEPISREFPEKLRGTSATTFYIKGDTGRLNRPLLTVLPSAKPSGREKSAATACIEEVAKTGIVILFGYGTGDRDLARTALQKGAELVFCLTEGILNFRIRKDLQNDWDESRITVFSITAPNERWSHSAALRSKQIMLTLARTALITEPHPQWVCKLSKNGKTNITAKVFYVIYNRDDSKMKHDLNCVQAMPIGKNKYTGKPNVTGILESMGMTTYSSVRDQMHLPTDELEEQKINDDVFSNSACQETTVHEEQEKIKSIGTYPKRLIEVDLPIKRISNHARREKSIRHGHISTLHIWWARRPLAACRAVICAALWPDPADPLCPDAFREKAQKLMLDWTTHERQALLSAESRQRFESARQNPKKFGNNDELRKALLDFIADFSNWDNSTKKEYLDTSRTLTQSAHEALGGEPGTKPLVVDPFAGGGSIPLEALRVGADTFASDLNPIAVLLNKVVLEYIPKYGQRLADEVRKWGEWIKKEAEKELAEFYPKDPHGATPIAYLWARTIQCEGPGCGAEVPLIRSLWLARKSSRSVALQLVPRPKAKRVDFKIIVKERGDWVDQVDPKEKITDPKFDGTLKRSSATCPCCGYTTSAERVRQQFRGRRGGADDARLLCVVCLTPGTVGRIFRLPFKEDLHAIETAKFEVTRRLKSHKGILPLAPNEELPYLRSIFNVQLLDVTSWGNLFSSRQLLALTTLVALVQRTGERMASGGNSELSKAVQTLLAFMLDKQADLGNSLCAWEPVAECPRHLFGRQAIGIVWDFAEGVVTSESSGGWSNQVDRTAQVLEAIGSDWSIGNTEQASATKHPLPDDSVGAFITDPPYYDAVPYADLSDFFYVWLKRCIGSLYPNHLMDELTPKQEEAVQLAERNPKYAYKTKEHFETQMVKALAEGRRVTIPTGIGVVVFAHKATAAWETMLKAVLDAGWVVQASWPIDTEMGSRLRAMDSATLSSSVHLVCRPRENPDGSIRTDKVGDWRDVLAELPQRIHGWLPRLAEEGVVGADAIFASLGPALEIFSRYSRVEKANGEAVSLKEYLEQVWAAVAKEALTMIFTGADVTGFEEDARLTAMWLWTLSTGNNGNGKGKLTEDDEEIDEEGDSGKPKKITGGYALEYDAARKIAQGLGAHLEKLSTVVEVRGDTAHLLPVSQRTRFLFGKDETQSPFPKRKRKEPQLKLGFIQEVEDVETKEGWGAKSSPRAGSTVLDRVHQSMILFAAGRSEALKRFLLEEGAGNDQRFWRLAQALSALYPKNSDEKRWVDGVLARKKGLGF
jgi:putative DNA methylase